MNHPSVTHTSPQMNDLVILLMKFHLQSGLTIYSIDRDEHQPNVQVDQLWFIVKQHPFDDYSFNRAVTLSKYYINKVNTGCTYDANIEKLIDDIVTPK